jgi:hypothetical protein
LIDESEEFGNKPIGTKKVEKIKMSQKSKTGKVSKGDD